jgi:DNA-directed RNA polymerase II subunit RPB2
MCNHFKAVMHTYSLTRSTRIETLSHMAWNLHVPLMRTPAFDWLEMGLRPHGANVLLMIATHCGYNQEDAIVVKQSFVDRGGFYGTVSKTFDARKGLSSTKGRRLRVGVGGHFEADAPLGSFTTTKHGGATSTEADIRSGLQDHGRVDYVLNTDARFSIRTYRSEIPRVGDKFASSHAQKGTIGQIVSEMDLPYTEDGLTPDILLNPHAIPSRTTTAQIVEVLYGILAAATATPMREFAFDEMPLATVEELLEKAGVRERGLVSLIDPVTGCRIKAKVYMGIGYYCRLKHIVNDKVRSQDILGGERCAMTKQPASGRKKRGGVRLNEMERWAMMGHGGSTTIHDCFTKLSDGTTITVQGSNGLSIDAPSDATPDMRSFESNYTVQKLQQTLQSAMIGMSFQTVAS